MINIETATISEKLRFLADCLLTPALSEIFDQQDLYNCVIGLGNRLTRLGELMPISLGMGNQSRFMAKFGITKLEAVGLFIAEYDLLDVDYEPDSQLFEHTTPNDAAEALRALARKYEQRGF